MNRKKSARARVYAKAPEGWLTRDAAAEAYRVSTRTISRWKASGRLAWVWTVFRGQHIPVFEPPGASDSDTA